MERSSSAATDRTGNTSTILMTVVLVALFAAITFFVVKAAGGTDVAANYSNTPNATVPGPPAFK